MGGSPNFGLAGEDWLRIGKGFLIAGGGFVVAFITSTVIPALAADSTSVTNMALTAAFGVAANALRLWLSDTR